MVDERLARQSTVPMMRPLRRPPTAKLILLDDDSESDGEVYRLRQDSTSIGRRDCDVCVANDEDISSHHAVVGRTAASNSRWTWRLTDQNSTNGSFVRVSSWSLDQSADMLIGAVPFRWIVSASITRPAQPFTGELACLDESVRFQTIRITAPVQLGSSPGDSGILIQHPTLNQRHARIEPIQGRWQITDCDSVNGIWVRIIDHPLEHDTRFLLGQQRFRFLLPQHPEEHSGGLSLEASR